MKWLSLLLALPFLGACDGDKLPSQPSPPAKPEVQADAGNRAPASPLGSVESEGGEPPNIEIELESVAGEDSEELPSERVVSVPEPKPEPVVPVREAAKKKVAVEEVELPEPELDLSLPSDWAEELDPDQNTATIRLLPPLFESSEDSRSLQMSGRLLPGLEQDEALIDGAQINFELKR
ncbi:hypothetical protein [Pseudomonas sp. SST3]|uniref:hypothetical protein n=1 Tax=Pseudomonas sp. SST3 TaxID=2267882 RepID=UPI000DFA555E|nr:hypothetical protein [Pseudomonas sp. SST3]NKQ11877.1 hypothetical protein [Pseudomonas sp. SST3]